MLIATDAWKPQINGVVRTLDILGTELTKFGFEVKYLEPGLFSTLPLPSYPEIKLALNPWWHTPDIIREFDPDAIHIATEGPIGLAARRYCLQNERPFTTSFHTRFPEYIHARTGLPPHWFYKYLQWFHGPTSSLMVTTSTLMQELEGLRLLEPPALGSEVWTWKCSGRKKRIGWICRGPSGPTLAVLPWKRTWKPF